MRRRALGMEIRKVALARGLFAKVVVLAVGSDAYYDNFEGTITIGVQVSADRIRAAEEGAGHRLIDHADALCISFVLGPNFTSGENRHAKRREIVWPNKIECRRSLLARRRRGAVQPHSQVNFAPIEQASR